MANEIRNNVETMLMNALDEYLKYDSEGIFSTNIHRARKIFSPSELATLDLMLRSIEDYLYNIIFLTDKELELDGNNLELTEKIFVIKADDAYKFAKKGPRNIVFDVINQESVYYVDFDAELSGYFENNQKRLSKVHN